MMEIPDSISKYFRIRRENLDFFEESARPETSFSAWLNELIENERINKGVEFKMSKNLDEAVGRLQFIGVHRMIKGGIVEYKQGDKVLLWFDKTSMEFEEPVVLAFVAGAYAGLASIGSARKFVLERK